MVLFILLIYYLRNAAMKLSQKGEYGIGALLELASRYGEGSVQANTIAARRGIPAQYLQQILLTLRRAGLIRSERGPHGGHALARSPAEITLLEAMQALEGTAAPAPCADPTAQPACGRQELCALLEVWRRVDSATEAILRAVTLADLAQRERELNDSVMYYI